MRPDVGLQDLTPFCMLPGRRNLMATSQSEKAARFRALHQAPGAFVIPNP